MTTVYNYTLLEQWLEEYKGQLGLLVPPKTHIQELFTTETNYGMEYRTGRLTVAWVDGADQIHYWRMKTMVQQMFHGKPSSEEEAAKDQYHKAVHALLRAWLIEQGVNLRLGFPGFPKTVTLYDGTAGFLKYEEGRGWYHREELPTPEYPVEDPYEGWADIVADWRDIMAVLEQEGFPATGGDTLAGHIQSTLAQLKRGQG